MEKNGWIVIFGYAVPDYLFALEFWLKSSAESLIVAMVQKNHNIFSCNMGYSSEKNGCRDDTHASYFVALELFNW